MLFLADESCDFAVVRALRAAGHDVAAMADLQPRAEDRVVLEMPRREARILLTEDKDFGELVYAFARPSAGVVLVRFPAAARASLPGAITDLVNDAGDRLAGGFVVVQPGRTRISRTPGR